MLDEGSDKGVDEVPSEVLDWVPDGEDMDVC